MGFVSPPGPTWVESQLKTQGWIRCYNNFTRNRQVQLCPRGSCSAGLYTLAPPQGILIEVAGPHEGERIPKGKEGRNLAALLSRLSEAALQSVVLEPSLAQGQLRSSPIPSSSSLQRTCY